MANSTVGEDQNSTPESDQDEYSFRLSYSTADEPPPRPSDSSSIQLSPSSFDPPMPPQSPWCADAPPPSDIPSSYMGLMGSLVREEGHIYSLAAAGEFLYTGSDSKSIRVWKNLKEYTGFKCNSGLVKAIVISGDRIFSGHQDGKIRVWKVSQKDPSVHKKIGTLPTLKATIKTSFKPNKYVEVKNNRNSIWIRHVDAISSLSLNEDQSLLYSASWDKTIKVWRVSDSKCLESISAHDDSVNAVVAGFDGLVFSGSADGTVKAWRREMEGKGTKHFFSQTLLKQECAVTSLAINPDSTILYGGSSDGLVNFWERDNFLSHGGTLRGHKLAVLCLAASGDLVFSGSADTNICVWKRQENDHLCLTVLSGHSGPVKCLAVEEEDGGENATRDRHRHLCMVYSGSLDKSVKIWRVSGQATPIQPPAGQLWDQGSRRSQMIPSSQSFESRGNLVGNERRRQ